MKMNDLPMINLNFVCRIPDIRVIESRGFKVYTYVYKIHYMYTYPYMHNMSRLSLN